MIGYKEDTIMTMKLDKQKIEPKLKEYSFFEVVPGVFSKVMEDTKYGVDFGNNTIFRLEKDNSKTTDDKEDENLVWLKGLCMDAMFKNPGGDCEELPEDQTFEDIHGPIDERVDEVQEAEYTEISHVTETAISNYSGDIVRPAISAVQAKEAWKEYLNMRKVILEPSDFQKIQGKDFIKKSGWRKFATFYNLTDKIVEENRIPDNGGFIWKIKVVCTAPNGRVTEGVAMCSSKEKSGARIEHDVYSTAHTRAKNRAISDMIAAGEVSAEEMQH